MRAWMIGLAAVAAPIAILGGAAMAADDAPRPLTLERLFASPDLAGPQPRALKLSPDGKLVTSLKNRAPTSATATICGRSTPRRARSGCWSIRRRSAPAPSCPRPRRCSASARGSPGKSGIVAYDWAPDGKSILVPIDGDLYLATLDGKVTRLTKTPGGELNPVISPAGGYRQLRARPEFVRPAARRRRGEALTSDGAGTVHWGEAEFVAQEEMDRRTGYWWSPDERLVAVERFDEAPVGIVTRAAIGADGTKVYDQRYPAAGTPNVRVELWVIDPTSGAKVKVDLGADPDIYLARVDWTPDGKTLLVQRENRDTDAARHARGRPCDGQGEDLVQREIGAEELGQFDRRLPRARRRQPDLVVGTRRVRASLSLRQGQVDAADQGAVGRHRTGRGR